MCAYRQAAQIHAHWRAQPAARRRCRPNQASLRLLMLYTCACDASLLCACRRRMWTRTVSTQTACRTWALWHTRTRRTTARSTRSPVRSPACPGSNGQYVFDVFL